MLQSIVKHHRMAIRIKKNLNRHFVDGIKMKSVVCQQPNRMEVEKEKVFLCHVPFDLEGQRRKKDNHCPNCFQKFPSLREVHYHLLHDCWFAKFVKSACKETGENCKCAKLFCHDCYCSFITEFEYTYHHDNVNCHDGPCSLCQADEGILAIKDDPENEETDQKFKCVECKKSFATHFNLEKHTFSCEGVGDYGFKFSHYLPSEKLTLPFEPKYKCGFCQVTFDTRKSYKFHEC